MKKVFSFGLLVAAAILVTFSSCKPANTVKNVTSVRISETAKTIRVDEEFTLTAKVEPADAANKEVTWTSDKPTIASVDANGKVKGLAIGEATITVNTVDGNKSRTCKVTVIDKNQATEVDLYSFAYRDNLGQEGKHFYSIMLMDKGMIQGDEVKDGPMYSIFICSDAPKSDTDFSPRMGTYTMGAEKQFEPMFIVRNDNLTYAGMVKDKKISATKSPFVEGELVVEAQKITFKGKDADGKEYNLAFAGTYKVTDASQFAGEPKTPTTLNKEWNDGQLSFGQVAGNVKPIILATAADAESMIAYVMFFVASDVTKLTEGTYNVNDTQGNMTVMKSRGMSGNQVYPSIVCKLNGQYVDAPYYYFDNGTVTVTATDITFNVKSHFGSTLTLKYTGSMDVKSSSGAPQKAKVLSPMKSRKTLAF